MLNGCLDFDERGNIYVVNHKSHAVEVLSLQAKHWKTRIQIR